MIGPVFVTSIQSLDDWRRVMMHLNSSYPLIITNRLGSQYDEVNIESNQVKYGESFLLLQGAVLDVFKYKGEPSPQSMRNLATLAMAGDKASIKSLNKSVKEYI